MQICFRIPSYFVLVILRKKKILKELICYFRPVINNPAEFRDLEAFLCSSCECFSFCRVSPVALDVFLQHGGATIWGCEVLQLFNADLRNDRVRNVSQRTALAVSAARTFPFWKAPSVALPLPAARCWRGRLKDTRAARRRVTHWDKAIKNQMGLDCPSASASPRSLNHGDVAFIFSRPQFADSL